MEFDGFVPFGARVESSNTGGEANGQDDDDEIEIVNLNTYSGVQSNMGEEDLLERDLVSAANEKSAGKGVRKLGGMSNPSNYSFGTPITISDDQSVREKVDERRLVALRGQTAAPQPIEKIVRFQEVEEMVNPLQDHQVQLMLLEQQNKKRSILASLEQGRTPRESLGTSTVIGPQHHSSLPQVPNGNDQVGIETNGSNQSGEECDEERDVWSLGRNPEGLEIEDLQNLIRRLQAKAKQLGAPTETRKVCRYQVFYRILCPSGEPTKKGGNEGSLSNPFFDRPEWVRGQGSSGTYRCAIPVDNLDLYLEKNRDISFIVYQTYCEPSPKQLSGRINDMPNISVRPVVNESIRPIKQDLVDALATILESREEYSAVLHSFRTSSELLAPYLFFYHHRNDPKPPSRSSTDSTQEQLRLLFDFMTRSQGGTYNSALSLISQGRISYQFIDYLFKPGDVLVQSQNEQYAGWVATDWPRKDRSERMLRRDCENSTSSGTVALHGPGKTFQPLETDTVLVHHWAVAAWHWDFDGSFVPRHDILKFSIRQELDSEDHGDPSVRSEPSAADIIQITDLVVFPIQFLPTHILIRLRRRGQTFWKCRKRRYVSYRENDRDGIDVLAEERYMIDLTTYRKLHKKNPFETQAFRKGLGKELETKAMSCEKCPDSPFELLLPPKIKGYNLRRKKWHDLEVDRICDVVWNKEAFSRVVVDRKLKDLIRALVGSQLAAERSTDLIAGKGNGLILLLHGSPGTGKTLTAESVAEIAEKPLYRVTCGDVGTKAEAVEKYLESVFYLGKLWGCVVLLDEAEVFLEQRSLEDLERNALVSVFLRVLEYYEGILVLTSNRVGTFDEAFKSRIQLALHYPTLGSYQRLRIWENFIDRLETFDDGTVDTADLKDHLDDLSQEKMNGRQIRNAITTARQYSEWKGNTLTYSQLKDVIEISGRFDQYLDKLHGGYTEDQLAEEEGIR